MARQPSPTLIFLAEFANFAAEPRLAGRRLARLAHGAEGGVRARVVRGKRKKVRLILRAGRGRSGPGSRCVRCSRCVQEAKEGRVERWCRASPAGASDTWRWRRCFWLTAASYRAPWCGTTGVGFPCAPVLGTRRCASLKVGGEGVRYDVVVGHATYVPLPRGPALVRGGDRARSAFGRAHRLEWSERDEGPHGGLARRNEWTGSLSRTCASVQRNWWRSSRASGRRRCGRRITFLDRGGRRCVTARGLRGCSRASRNWPWCAKGGAPRPRLPVRRVACWRCCSQRRPRADAAWGRRCSRMLSKIGVCTGSM